MSADAALSSELTSLRGELLASRAERSSVSTDAGTDAAATQPDDAADQHQLGGEFGGFVKAISEFIQEAEKDVLQRPTAKLVVAMAVGLLIGRLVRRR